MKRGVYAALEVSLSSSRCGFYIACITCGSSASNIQPMHAFHPSWCTQLHDDRMKQRCGESCIEACISRVSGERGEQSRNSHHGSEARDSRRAYSPRSWRPQRSSLTAPHQPPQYSSHPHHAMSEPTTQKQPEFGGDFSAAPHPVLAPDASASHVLVLGAGVTGLMSAW